MIAMMRFAVGVSKFGGAVSSHARVFHSVTESALANEAETRIRNRSRGRVETFLMRFISNLFFFENRSYSDRNNISASETTEIVSRLAFTADYNGLLAVLLSPKATNIKA